MEAGGCSTWLAKRLAFLRRRGDVRLRWLFSTWSPTLEAESRRRPKGKAPYFRECHRLPRFNDLFWHRKLLYRELVEGFDSDPLEMRLDLSLELGARVWLLEQFRVLVHLAAQPERVIPLRLGPWKWVLSHMPDWSRCGRGMEQTVEYTFYHCEQLRLFWDLVGKV